MKGKKVFISIRSDESSFSPIQSALEQAALLVDHQVVNNFEDADLIVVDSSSKALTMLKENDQAVVIIAIFPELNEEIGACSLKKMYPGRVMIGQIFEAKEGTDDVVLVPYIMLFASEEKKEE